MEYLRRDPVSPLYAKPSNSHRKINQSSQKSVAASSHAFFAEAPSNSDLKSDLDFFSFNFKSVEGVNGLEESNPSLACSMNSFNLDNSIASLTQSFEFKYLPESSDQPDLAFQSNCVLPSGNGPSQPDIKSQSAERFSKLSHLSHSKHSSIRPRKQSRNEIQISRDLEAILDTKVSICELQQVKKQSQNSHCKVNRMEENCKGSKGKELIHNIDLVHGKI